MTAACRDTRCASGSACCALSGGGLDYLVGLIPERFGHLSMALLRLIVGKVQLRLACLVRCNLRCVCSSLIFLGEMLLDLLTAGTRCGEILLTVALDFRLTTLAALDFIT